MKRGVAPNDVVAKLKAYDPGHDLPALRRRLGPIVELGSNENSFGPSPRVFDALRNVSAEEIWRYPDPLGLSLRRALAAKLDVDASNLVLGNGSHELLMLIAQCFAQPGDEVVFSEFGFAVFPIATAAVGATPVRVPALALDHEMSRGHDLDAIAAAVTPRTKIVFVANPNNPTGTWVPRDALAAFVAKIPADVLVVVDEAYFEYAQGITAADLVRTHGNLIVTRTFSKGYGLAGLRVGYAVAHESIVASINRLRESFNVNALALVAAEAALADDAHLADVIERTRAERERVLARLRTKFTVHASLTNFLLIDFRVPAAEIEAELMARNIIVRPMGGYGLPTCLRVTIGDARENDALLAALGV